MTINIKTEIGNRIIEAVNNADDSETFSRAVADILADYETVVVARSEYQFSVTGAEAGRRVREGDLRHQRYGQQSQEQMLGAVRDAVANCPRAEARPYAAYYGVANLVIGDGDNMVDLTAKH